MINFEKWLEGNVVNGVDEDELVVPLSDLKAFMEEYVVVPRKPTLKMVDAGRDARKSLSTVTQTYIAMLEGFERE